jgi:hypothetical protein
MTISTDERETLERWTRRASTAQALAQRARVILGCAAGKSNTRVAHELRLTKQTVGKWYPQDAENPSLAGPPAAIPSALHAHQCLLAQPRRTLVRLALRETD